MTKDQKNKVLGGVLFVVVIAALFGIRAWRMAQVESYLEDAVLINGLLEEKVSYDGKNYLVPPTYIYDGGSELPALNDPKFDSVSVADSYLADDIEGIDIEVNGEHRFYSYQILNWHEVVNDSFNGVDLSITHCSLCISSAVYVSELDGNNLELESSGKIYNNNQLLESKDGSLWFQLRGMAISGKYAGQELEEYPFRVMTWSTWNEIYPDGYALSTDTGFVRDYASHPYGQYGISTIIYFPLNIENEMMGTKWEIEGLEIDDNAIAFSDKIMLGKYVANVTLGDVPIIGFWHEEQERTYVFSSTVNEQVLTFSFDWDTGTITDDETGSVWTNLGQAVSGELVGTQLDSITTKPSLWMCWGTQYTDSAVAHIEIVPADEIIEETGQEESDDEIINEDEQGEE